jgi:hypothetical protein
MAVCTYDPGLGRLRIISSRLAYGLYSKSLSQKKKGKKRKRKKSKEEHLVTHESDMKSNFQCP